jgi:hypothetical protein
MGRFNSLADEKHVAFIVLDHKNLPKMSVRKITLGV